MATAKKAASAASKTKATESDTPATEETKATAEANTSDADTSSSDGDAPAAITEQGPAAGSGDTGPMTGTPSPVDDKPRTADATVVNPGGGAAPLAPTDVAGQTEPTLGHDESSTDHLYAVTGGQSIAGESVQRLVDDEGNSLTADDIFEDGDTSKTFLVVKQQINEVFRYPNTTVDCTRVLFRKGRHVSRDHAQRVLDTVAAHG